MQNLTEFLIRRRLDDHMQVVRHDHPSVQSVALAVEMAESVDYNLSHLGLTEKTFAVALVEPTFAFIAEPALVFMLRVCVPGLGMKLQPCFQFFAPFALKT